MEIPFGDPRGEGRGCQSKSKLMIIMQFSHSVTPPPRVSGSISAPDSLLRIISFLATLWLFEVD